MSDDVPSTRGQRWLKYGGNVLLTSLIVVALAVLITFGAERHPVRKDLTATGLYSLQPQTLKILGDLKSPVTLVNLYTRTSPPANPNQSSAQAAAKALPPGEAAQMVDDLLQEYSVASHEVTAESIDPVTSPGKVDELIERVEKVYSGELKQYNDFFNTLPAKLDKIQSLSEAEGNRFSSLPILQNQDEAQANAGLSLTLFGAFETAQSIAPAIKDIRTDLQHLHRQRPPDYRGTATSIQTDMDGLQGPVDHLADLYARLAKTAGLPPDVTKFVTETLPQYQELRKQVDDLATQVQGLKELKLDSLLNDLKEPNTILVMGTTDCRVVKNGDVWLPPEKRGIRFSDSNPQPRFDGEQQLTRAILSITAPPHAVCFVRAGGPPLTEESPQSSGYLAEVGRRLRLYNFDVTERDVSGTPDSPAPTSNDPDPNTTWIVCDFAKLSQPGSPPSRDLESKLTAHLQAGGSALILTQGIQRVPDQNTEDGPGMPSMATPDPLDDALAPWGIAIRGNIRIVHEKITAQSGEEGDVVQEYLRYPIFFDLTEYGDHPLTTPVNSLQGFFDNLTPVIIGKEPDGATATPLLPVPTEPQGRKSWGSVTVPQVLEDSVPDLDLKFDPNAGDIPAPLNAGAAIEKSNGQRLVVLAAGVFMNDSLLKLTANQIDPDSPAAVRFPGNGELFTNAVFWAAHQDTLIDISPAAMDVGRIRDISPAMLKFWRLGILLIGLPGLVLVVATAVYLRRMD